MLLSGEIFSHHMAGGGCANGEMFSLLASPGNVGISQIEFLGNVP